MHVSLAVRTRLHDKSCAVKGGGELSKKRDEAADETSEDDCDTKPCGDGRNDPIAS